MSSSNYHTSHASKGSISDIARRPLMSFLSLVPTASTPYQPRQGQTLPEREAHGFLTLAPAMSDSYPRRTSSVAPLVKPLQLTHEDRRTSSALASPTRVFPNGPNDTGFRSRRLSSSAGSDASSAKLSTKSMLGARFLKLGPVHWGEHIGAHKGDWYDAEDEPLSPTS